LGAVLNKSGLLDNDVVTLAEVAGVGLGLENTGVPTKFLPKLRKWVSFLWSVYFSAAWRETRVRRKIMQKQREDFNVSNLTIKRK